MRPAAILLGLFLLFAPSPGWAKEPGLRVLTSFLPMYLFARNVVGDVPGVSVDMMLPASLGCPHDYALTPGDMRKIGDAALFLVNGRGMEQFLGPSLHLANPDLQIVETAAEVEAIDGNPHTWVSPRNAVRQVRAIEQALAERSPGNAGRFRRNADAYAERLEALARDFEAAAEGFRKRDIVTFHDVFDYLARDLGLRVVGRIEERPGQGPSAGEVAALVRTIRETKAAAVFAEPQYPARLAEVIAKEAGVPVRVLDPVATGSMSATTYEDVMRDNLRTLTEVLSGR